MIKTYDLSFLDTNKIKDFLLTIDTNDHGLLTSGVSTYNFGRPLLLYPKMRFLYLIIKKYVKMYCDSIDVSDFEFINAWFNITNPGNKLIKHNHGKCGLSGAFYISANEKSVPLIFPDASIKPYPGLLILFPSSLDHYTEEEIEQRIVISFNVEFL